MAFVRTRKLAAAAGVASFAAILAGTFLWMIPHAAAREIEAACNGIAARTEAPGVLCGKATCALPMAAPDFTVMASDGTELTLSSLRGQVVLINFWASWCGTCKLEKASLSGYAGSLPDGMKIITIASDNEWAKVLLSVALAANPLAVSERFRSDNAPPPTMEEALLEYQHAAPKGVPYPVYLDPPNATENDASVGAVAQRWGVSKVPESFLIDRDGMIRYYLVNKRDWTSAAVQTCAESLLDE